jgi:hypothetical protein
MEDAAPGVAYLPFTYSLLGISCVIREIYNWDVTYEFTTIHLEVVESDIHGHGLVTCDALPSFTILGIYTGVSTDSAESDDDYVCKISQDHCVSSRYQGNEFRFMNCSTDANTVLYTCREQVYVLTVKDVEPCSELLIDYGPTYYGHHP